MIQVQPLTQKTSVPTPLAKLRRLGNGTTDNKFKELRSHTEEILRSTDFLERSFNELKDSERTITELKEQNATYEERIQELEVEVKQWRDKHDRISKL